MSGEINDETTIPITALLEDHLKQWSDWSFASDEAVVLTATVQMTSMRINCIAQGILLNAFW